MPYQRTAASADANDVFMNCARTGCLLSDLAPAGGGASSIVAEREPEGSALVDSVVRPDAAVMAMDDARDRG